jgi:hypothetical protein
MLKSSLITSTLVVKFALIYTIEMVGERLKKQLHGFPFYFEIILLFLEAFRLVSVFISRLIIQNTAKILQDLF